MSRTPIIAGNWKCNMRLDSAFQLANAIRERVADIDEVEKIVCPPFMYLPTVETVLMMSEIALGAQNCHWEDDVAATGEMGPQQLEELVDYVILGHSERRHVFGETDGVINRKVKAALATNLKAIFCVGETLDEREANQTEAVLLRQTREGLAGIAVPETFVIAYEPVWAIGTGRAATTDDADSAITLIRREIASMLGEATAEEVRILYGGSVTPDNIADFMGRPNIDGALVGGASLKADAFSAIIEKTAAARA